MTTVRIETDGPETYLIVGGRRWRVVDVRDGDEDPPERLTGDQVAYARARMFLSADGDRRRERRVYYHPGAPGDDASRTLDDPELLATQLRNSRPWPTPVTRTRARS